MNIERTADGLEARLRPRGIGRFFSAGFLAVWLCGWAAGETIVLWFLVTGALALLTGRPPEPGRAPLEPTLALVAGCFLLFWLAFWTVGGVLAIRQLLRLLWSEDRVVAGDDALEIHRRLGPFRSTTRIARADLLGIEAIPRRSRLVAETARGLEELTNLGTDEERASVVAAVRGEFGLDGSQEASESSIVLPTGWVETLDVEGQPVLVKDPSVRRAQARVAWMATAAMSALAAAGVRKTVDHPEWAGLAGLLAGAAALLAWGAWRLTMTRPEWRLGSARLTLCRRESRDAEDLFEGVALELIESTDSDGDVWYTLNAVGGPPAEASPPLTDRKTRRMIAHVMGDPVTPRRLGAWIAQRAGLRFDNQATPGHRNEMWAEAIARLESSGRFGRFIASRLPRSG